jgi:hypothetical protein
MSTTPPAPPRTFWQRWKDFWFSAADPTTLGFMRIATGILVLYIHLVYSLDLQAFFGKYGWYSADRVERERKEFPWQVGSLTEWNENTARPALPDFPHRRQAVATFIRGLPERSADRALALRFLNRVTAYENNEQTREALLYLVPMGTSDQVLNAHLGALVHENQRAPHDEARIPPFFAAAPQEERAKIADEIRAFWAVLPRDRGFTPDRVYVLNHLIEMERPTREAFVGFLNTLPEDLAERDKLVSYVEHWNSDPRKLLRQGNTIFSVWFHVTDPTQMAAIHALVLVLIVLFTVGFCTRVTSVLVWLACVGYIHRTQQVLFGMDTMMNILLIYLMIGNSGAALSVDRLIARYRAVRASLRRTGTIDDATRAYLAAPPRSVSAGFAIRLIQVHFCFIYLAAGLSKLKGPGWWSGGAFWDVMVNPEFTLMKYVWFEEFIRAVASIKPVFYTISTLGVWFTWGLEIAFPFLIWTRLRPVMLWLGVLLHAGIGVLMGLNLFELLMMILLLAFMPARVIRDRLRGGDGLPKLILGYNPAGAIDARTAAVVVAVDPDAQVTAEPRKGGTLPALAPAGGSPVTGPAAVALLVGQLRLLRPLRFFLWVPGVSGLLARWLFPTGSGKAGGPPGNGSGVARTGPSAPAAAS